MKKKLCSIFLILNIVFVNLFGAYVNAYATAADIVVGGLISEGTAMSTLMTMFGVTPPTAALAVAGGVAAWGLQQVEKYKQYMGAQSEYESEAVANQAAGDLVTGVAHGVVDTASKAYSSFKSWLSSLASDNMPTIPAMYAPANTLTPFCVGKSNGLFFTFRCSVPIKYTCKDYGTRYVYYFFMNNQANIYTYYDGQFWGNLSDWQSIDVGSDTIYYIATNVSGTVPINDSVLFPQEASISDMADAVYHWNPSVVVPSTSDYIFPNDLLSGLGERDKTLEDLEQQGISATGAIGTTGTGSRSVDISNALDRTGTSSMDKLLEKVYNGEISWSDFMSALGVATVVNTATGTQAISIDRTNTAKFEKAEEYEASKDYIPPITDITPSPVYDDADFTIKNLETIFPFCIPFDLYDFISILAAEPQAPHWRLKASFIGRDDLYLDIDLKSWDKVAEYCRDFELLLYIVGLILITRNLIRG